MPAPRAPLPSWLESELQFDPEGLLRFCVGGRPVGWMLPALAQRLTRWPEVFSVGQDRVDFAPGLDAAATRSLAIAEVLQRLREEGAVTGWRDEAYRVPPRGAQGGATEPELFRMERAARKLFGIESHASHLNGLVRTPQGMSMWIARRSPAKSVDPDRLDNVVAGGIAADTNAWATLLKECGEEAGIPEELARKAKRCGTLRFRRRDPEGVDAQRIELFDLELPQDFVPVNRDGEVAEFRLMDVDEVARQMQRPGEFTVDAALVAGECLGRCLTSSARDGHGDGDNSGMGEH